MESKRGGGGGGGGVGGGVKALEGGGPYSSRWGELTRSNIVEKNSEELVSDCDDLDDNRQDQCVPHSNPDELSQNSPVKTVDQAVELVECNHPDAIPVNGERVTIDESMLLNSLNGHNGAVDVHEMGEVHNSPGGVGLQPERQTILENPNDATMEEKTSSDECSGNAEDSNDKNFSPSISSNEYTGVSTGNWGCGAFGGNPEIKSMIQWIAASQALRPFVNYYTFEDASLERLGEVIQWILRHQWTVGELWHMLIEYSSKRLRGETSKGFFSWLLPNGGPKNEADYMSE